MRLLPDASVWVDYLRGRDAAVVDELDGHLERESVFMCGPVIAELLAGTAVERREDLWLALGSLPWSDLDQLAWQQIGELAFELRRRGTPVPIIDIAIAVSALNVEAELWTRDADFQRIREALPALNLHT